MTSTLFRTENSIMCLFLNGATIFIIINKWIEIWWIIILHLFKNGIINFFLSTPGKMQDIIAMFNIVVNQDKFTKIFN